MPVSQAGPQIFEPLIPMTLKKDPTARFSDRVEDYIKYRPHYPTGMVYVLTAEMGLRREWIVADIGSGTGISSIPFLDNQNTVYAVEPNKEMREAAEVLFKDKAGFKSVDGSAEKTTLPANSVDLIFCGQAFHWFDPKATKIEFQRILKKTGHILIAWNRRSDDTSFQKSYENMLIELAPEYKQVTHAQIQMSDLESFFSPKSFQTRDLYNAQTLDLAGLKGRLMSSSYCPKSGKAFDALMAATEQLFERYKDNGFVTLKYITNLFWS
jgi:ubiquinone/menaquinone biosynthesis C-methylase UbiE